jgi:NADH:ubiquinone oxidoreductase subunit 3 (subunit A)
LKYRMGDIVLFFFLQNVFIFGLIFWLLTWAGEYVVSKKNHVSKRQFYECGFKSLSELNVQINMNFTMLCVFLVLYDIEFTLLFPVLFNFSYVTYTSFFLFLIFIFFIVLSLYYDIQMNSLSWQF